MPLPLVSQLNTKLMHYFVKKYTVKRTAMAFGKMLPVGIGAAVGGGGNRLMGKKIVANARTAFTALDRHGDAASLPAVDDGPAAIESAH